MPDQRRMGYHWNLRKVMASRNLWKTSELQPLLKSRGINLSDTQVYRLITGEPERIPARTFAALCDILDCSPNDLFEPFVEIRAAASANAPRHTEGIAAVPKKPIARRIKLLPDPNSAPDE